MHLYILLIHGKEKALFQCKISYKVVLRDLLDLLSDLSALRMAISTLGLFKCPLNIVLAEKYIFVFLPSISLLPRYRNDSF